MTFDEYQSAQMKTAPSLDKKNAYADCCLGLTGESGEVADIIKKHLFHDHALDIPHLLEEMGDVFWYLSWLANICGVSLEEIAIANIEKLRKRYPDGFDPERSIHRE